MSRPTCGTSRADLEFAGHIGDRGLSEAGYKSITLALNWPGSFTQAPDHRYFSTSFRDSQSRWPSQIPTPICLTFRS